MANAALSTSHQLEAVPFPVGLPRRSRQEQQSQQRKVANDPHHMTLVQDAYAAANSLTILEREEDYKRLRKAEETELERCVTKWVPPDGTLLPRPDAVTILDLSLKHSDNVFQILDAAQFLARDPDVDGCRAAQTTRFAFLSGSTAKMYIRDHGSQFAPGEMTSVLNGERTTAVCLTWYGSVDCAENEVEVCSALISIAFCDTAAEYAVEIRNKIASAWDSRGYYPTGRLSRAYSDFHNAMGAYVQGSIECASDFWKITRAPSILRKSQYVMESSQYVGFLEFPRIYLRIIPRNIVDRYPDPKARLTDPNVFHGMLLCQKGWKAEANEFCKRSHDEEVARARRSNVVYGLRDPKDQSEDVIGMHILTVTVQSIEVGKMVTSFGLKAAPGQSLSRPNETFKLPCLQRCLVPLDDEFLQHHCVCPVARQCCDPPDANLALAQFKVWEDAISEFEGEFQEVGSRERKRTREELAEQVKGEEGPPTPRIRVITPPPNQEEMDALQMFHMDLSHPAVRLGDAYSELARREGASPLTAFFSVLSARVGADESVTTGFAHAVQVYHKQDKLDKEFKDLNDELSSLKSANETTSTTSNEPLHRPELNQQGKEALLRGMKRGVTDLKDVGFVKSVRVAFPLTKDSIKAVLQLMALWPGLDRTALDGIKADCREQGMDPSHKTILDALCAVFGTMLRLVGGATTTRVLIIYESAVETEHSFQFYTVTSNAEPVTLGVHQVLNADLCTTPVLGYNEQTNKLFYYSPQNQPVPGSSGSSQALAKG